MPIRSRIVLLVSVVFVGLIGCAGPSMSTKPVVQSGLQNGDDIIPWNPIHVAGPNAGTNACPVCTYLNRPAIVIFTRDGKNWPVLATRLQDLVNQQHKIELKGFVVVLDSTPEHLKQLAADLKITQIGLCYPDPAERDKDLQEYKINPTAENTVMIYKDLKVAANFVDLDATDFDRVETAVANFK